MAQIGTTRGHVQGFRSVHKSLSPSTTSIPIDSPEVVHIDCYTDPDTLEDFILWEEIQQAFDGALSVRHNTKVLPFVKGKDYRALEPRRIEAAPDVVLDVVVGDERVTTTDAATMDMIASLQIAVPEPLLNKSTQTPIEGVTRNPPSGNEPEVAQDNNHNDSLENTPSPQGSQVYKCYSQDSNNGSTIDTQWLEATSYATKRLNDPQDEIAAKDMTLMQTIVNANQGDVHAQVALGDRYKDGREVQQDYHKAMNWYLKAAEQGHCRAQFNIGLLYEEGHYGVPQNRTKAFEWFLKVAVQGFLDAQVKVLQAYTDGSGVSRDNIKAMEWSIKAAENGHAERQCYMGAAYEKGHGVPQSDSRSIEWYLKSAVQGFAEAQERVADAFETGRGVPENGHKAVEWYTKAADQGVAEAQFALGRIHKLGLRGFPRDRSKAADWFIKAAVQGHTEAQSLLREIYRRSLSNSDLDSALDLATQSKITEWFMNAADQGVAHAQCCMAHMYVDGRGVDKDNAKAFEWSLKAAEQGDERAQIRVALWYGSGIGVTQSREKSIEWHLTLAKRGSDWAVQHLKDMIGNKLQ